MKFAVIDIGSNSVRLLSWADGTSLYKRLITTRLAEGMKEGELSEASMRRTADAVRIFSEEGERANARVVSFATAAVRSSKNGGKFCELVKRMCGQEVDVVSGEEEAELALCGALGNEDGAVLDVGGASSEYGVRKNGKTVFSVSLPVGAVRLHERCGDREELLRAAIWEAISSDLEKPCGKVYAVGGTASTLASVKLGLEHYDPVRLQGCSLPFDWVEGTANALLSMTKEERSLIRGMEKDRADIIAGGALLVAMLMKKLSLSELLFSDRDNLEGYLVLRGLV